MNDQNILSEARSWFFGLFFFLGVLTSCTEHSSSDSILMVNGSYWELSAEENIHELDEGRIERFGSLISLFREEPNVALYRSVVHPSYEYFLALPTDDSSWTGEDFQCQSLSSDSTRLHLANRLVDGENRLIILYLNKLDSDADICGQLEERSATISSTE